MTSKDSPEERVDRHTTIKAYGNQDSHIEESSGYDKIEQFSDQETCEICGLTARNDEELRRHLQGAHEK
jgi:hypothetical protein